MQTMFIYDDLGEILVSYLGRTDAPVGVNSLVVDVPVDCTVIKINVDGAEPFPEYHYVEDSSAKILEEKIIAVSKENEALKESNNNLQSQITESNTVVNKLLGLS